MSRLRFHRRKGILKSSLRRQKEAIIPLSVEEEQVLEVMPIEVGTYPRMLKVDRRSVDERLDKFLASALVATRGQIRTLLEEGQILVNGALLKDHYRVKVGDEVTVLRSPDRTLEAAVLPENVPLDIKYEDEDVLVVEKPAGMVVHPAEGVRSGTLVNALLGRGQPLSTIGGAWRPGIVHRLDKDTSGLVMIAKNNRAHIRLSEQLRARTLHRVYAVLVHGKLAQDKGLIDAPIGRHSIYRHKLAVVRRGREARTRYEVQERFGGVTFLYAKLETGRTHQIRVHMKHLGHSVAGDLTYGGRRELVPGIEISRQALHAFQLEFEHPSTGELIKVESPFPEDFRRTLEALRVQSQAPATPVPVPLKKPSTGPLRKNILKDKPAKRLTGKGSPPKGETRSSKRLTVESGRGKIPSNAQPGKVLINRGSLKGQKRKRKK